MRERGRHRQFWLAVSVFRAILGSGSEREAREGGLVDDAPARTNLGEVATHVQPVLVDQKVPGSHGLRPARARERDVPARVHRAVRQVNHREVRPLYAILELGEVPADYHLVWPQHGGRLRLASGLVFPHHRSGVPAIQAERAREVGPEEPTGYAIAGHGEVRGGLGLVLEASCGDRPRMQRAARRVEAGYVLAGG